MNVRMLNILTRGGGFGESTSVECFFSTTLLPGGAVARLNHALRGRVAAAHHLLEHERLCDDVGTHVIPDPPQRPVVYRAVAAHVEIGSKVLKRVISSCTGTARIQTGSRATVCCLRGTSRLEQSGA